MRSFLAVGHCSESGAFDETTALPLLPILMGPLYPLSWRDFQLVINSFLVVTMPYEAVDLVCPVGGTTFRMFTLPPWTYSGPRGILKGQSRESGSKSNTAF